MILCFSGTGNSRFVADCLAESLQDQVVSLNDVLRSKEANPAFQSELPLVVCFPIYAWGMPLVVQNLLEKARFQGCCQAYFVATMGANSGKTDSHCRALCSKLGLEFKGFCGVVMPDNYVVLSKMKTLDQVQPVLRAAQETSRKLARAIAAGETIARDDKTALAGLKSGPVHTMFSKYAGDTKGYAAGEDCTLCGTCVRVCPLNNVSIVDGTVQFGAACTACYACIHRCPTQALNIVGKTEDKGRYVCPRYEEWSTAQNAL